MEDVFIGFGSNMGDPVESVREALVRLLSTPMLKRARVSSLYRTEPVGFEAQGWFVNGAAWLRSSLGPREILVRLLQVERDMGRARHMPGGPRVIDLDLLMHGSSILEEEDLRVPHPRMHQRRFVLEPLCEIAPDVIHPVLGKTARTLLEELGDAKAVERIGGWEARAR